MQVAAIGSEAGLDLVVGASISGTQEEASGRNTEAARTPGILA